MARERGRLLKRQRFATSNPKDFLSDYFDFVRTKGPGAIAQWLFANASNMTEEMFFDPKINWERIASHHLLALRACTPENVFTPVAKGGFLSKVARDAEFHGLAKTLFGDDYEFVNSLPNEQRPEVVMLMKLAYQHGIRPADRQVELM